MAAQLSSMTRTPVTAIVVCRNESRHLADCLSRLRWCAELIVVDLASDDGSASMARQFTPRVFHHPPSPIVEPVRVFAARHASHDWLLFVDPDERYSLALADDIDRTIAAHPGAGLIRLPMHYYFKRKRLTCTAWGKAVHYRPALVHRKRCDIQPLICRGFALREGATEATVHPTGDNPIVHYWMDGYCQLIAKHWRYARQEGLALHRTREAGLFELLVARPLRELRRNLLFRGGLQGGLRGVTLSLVYSAYLAASAWWMVAHRLRAVFSRRPSVGDALPDGVAARLANQRDSGPSASNADRQNGPQGRRAA